MTEFAAKYGPWALVTGASDGIGKSMAEDLASRGLNVILVARRQSLLEDLADKLGKDHGVQTHVIAADLGNVADVTRVNEESAALDVGLLAACAGFGTAGEMLTIEFRNPASPAKGIGLSAPFIARSMVRMRPKRSSAEPYSTVLPS